MLHVARCMRWCMVHVACGVSCLQMDGCEPRDLSEIPDSVVIWSTEADGSVTWADPLCLKPDSKPLVSCLYFSSFMVVSAMIMLNLVIGIMLTSMEKSKEEHAKRAMADLNAAECDPDDLPLVDEAEYEQQSNAVLKGVARLAMQMQDVVGMELPGVMTELSAICAEVGVQLTGLPPQPDQMELITKKSVGLLDKLGITASDDFSSLFGPQKCPPIPFQSLVSQANPMGLSMYSSADNRNIKEHQTEDFFKKPKFVRVRSVQDMGDGETLRSGTSRGSQSGSKGSQTPRAKKPGLFARSNTEQMLKNFENRALKSPGVKGPGSKSSKSVGESDGGSVRSKN
mmetsp:Transcript_13100/g.30928  ORF Transcript_13100/g.30928 Transcript_13100/m.30928 type:complete len:341 (+) Transcript_13100:31-1053(+)